MSARYAGRCITCGGGFAAGDTIDYNDWSGKCHCGPCADSHRRAHLAAAAADLAEC